MAVDPSDYRRASPDNPFSYMLGESFDGVLRGLMVCLPGRIMAFDEATQRAQVQCGIRRLVDGQPTTIPVIQNVTVCFPGNNGWYLWHEITPGSTEGLVHFSQRAVDTWINSGGVTTPVDFRMFSEQDAFFAPGFRSQPGAIPGFVNDGMGMSSYDGSTRVSLTSGEVKLEAGGQTLTLNGGGLKHNGTDVGDTHTHPQGDDSDGNSQQNTEPPQ